MSQWTKESALAELKRLAEKTHLLAGERRQSEEHIRWLVGSLRVLEQVFGRKSRYYLSVADLPWHETGTMIVDGWDPQAAAEERHQQAYRKQLDMARGLLLAGIDELKASTIEEVYKGKDTPPESSGLMKVLTLMERKLRKVIRETPKGEREVQNAVETLLIGAEVEHVREGESITYSSKKYIPDFSFSHLDLALEVKFCGKDGREKELIAEINDDIQAYKTKFGNLIFTVYDTGFIRDVDKFSGAFEKSEGVVVRVVKH